MPRPEKVQAVADIRERVEGANAVFLAEFAGLSVKEQQDLRRGLREVGSEFKVVKMTLARLAVSELGHDDILEWLMGPTGLAFAESDAASTAKVLRDFANDHALVVKGGLLGGEVLPPERISDLADLEPRDVLLAKIAGAFQAPMAKLAGLLQALPRDMASMMRQLADRKAEEAGESAEEAEAETEAADAAAAESDATTSEVAEGGDAPDGDDAPAAEAGEPEVATEEPAEGSDEPAEETTTDEDPADEAEEE